MNFPVRAKNMPVDSVDPASFEPPDLAELLHQRGLSHWLPALLELCERHQGWLADYELEPEMDPDYRPMSDILAAVCRLPDHPPHTDAALAKSLGSADFLARSALDMREGTVSWNPFQECYRSFCKRFPDRHPYWASIPKQIEMLLLQWMKSWPPPGTQQPA